MGPAAVGIRGWLGKVGPYGPEWPKGLWGDGMGPMGPLGVIPKLFRVDGVLRAVEIVLRSFVEFLENS